MVYERRHPRRSADDRIVERYTRRETPAQRARRIGRLRIPKEVIDGFNQQLDQDTAREARAIAQELTHTPTQETRTMTTPKRTPTTKKAELVPATPKPEPKAKATKKVKAAKPKAAKKAKATKPSDRATVLAAYTADKLKVQKQLKIGAVITYHGRNETLDGKSVKVTGYEPRGGVLVEHQGDRYTVSPHALLKPKK